MQTLDGGRIGIASQALGIAQASLELAASYVCSWSDGACTAHFFDVCGRVWMQVLVCRCSCVQLQPQWVNTIWQSAGASVPAPAPVPSASHRPHSQCDRPAASKHLRYDSVDAPGQPAQGVWGSNFKHAIHSVQAGRHGDVRVRARAACVLRLLLFVSVIGCAGSPLGPGHASLFVLALSPAVLLPPSSAARLTAPGL
jgi:hypothetical protein